MAHQNDGEVAFGMPALQVRTNPGWHDAGVSKVASYRPHPYHPVDSLGQGRTAKKDADAKDLF